MNKANLFSLDNISWSCFFSSWMRLLSDFSCFSCVLKTVRLLEEALNSTCKSVRFKLSSSSDRFKLSTCVQSQIKIVKVLHTRWCLKQLQVLSAKRLEYTCNTLCGMGYGQIQYLVDKKHYRVDLELSSRNFFVNRKSSFGSILEFSLSEVGRIDM